MANHGIRLLKGGLGGGVDIQVLENRKYLDIVQAAIDGGWNVNPAQRQATVNELIKILLQIDPASRKFKYTTRYRLKAAQLLMKADMDSWKKVMEACKLEGLIAEESREQGGVVNNFNGPTQVNNVELNDDIRIARVAKIVRDKLAAKHAHETNGHTKELPGAES